jgi:putative Mg2+ transporter-C (MgtC) family protein
MPFPADPLDIVLRILATLVASALIGFEREERGKAAGLRTTILVGIAACLAMVEVNLLLATTGKTPSSFSQIDPMRLPLGILSGVGFIGGGAILKRGRNLVGVTTAATLWFATVLGLVLGAGDYWLGAGGTLAGVVVVRGLRLIEPRMRRKRLGRVTIGFDPNVVPAVEVTGAVERAGLAVAHQSFKREGNRETRKYQVYWWANDDDRGVPDPLLALAEREGVATVDWENLSLGDN